MTSAQLITLDDGRVFPVYKGQPQAWHLCVTWEDQDEGFPKLRTVIRAMMQGCKKDHNSLTTQN